MLRIVKKEKIAQITTTLSKSVQYHKESISKYLNIFLKIELYPAHLKFDNFFKIILIIR